MVGCQRQFSIKLKELRGRIVRINARINRQKNRKIDAPGEKHPFQPCPQIRIFRCALFRFPSLAFHIAAASLVFAVFPPPCLRPFLATVHRQEFSELKIPYLRPATPQSIQSHTNRPDHHRHTHHPARQLSQKLTRRPVNQLIAAVTDSQKNHQPHQNTQHKADCCQAPIRNVLFQSLSPSLIFLLLSHAPHSIIRHIAFLLFLLLHKKVLVHMKTRTFALLNCICVF